jgi:hypothetical protein
MRASILFGLLAATASSFINAEANSKEVSAQDLQRGDIVVIGQLRQPLGTVLEIEGGCVDARDGAKLKNSLMVGRVDMTYWSAGIELEVRGQQLQTGKQYRLEGYESGEFVIAPKEEAKANERSLQLQFHTFFVSTKVQERTQSGSAPISIANIKITFSKDQVAPPEGVPKEAEGAGVGPDKNAAKDPTTKIEFGEVKDPSDHGPLSKLVVGRIAALKVSWADPTVFKNDEQAIAKFLRERLGSDRGSSNTFQVWSQGLSAPAVVAEVEHVSGKPGKLLIWWQPEDTTALCVYLDKDGKWWFCGWPDFTPLEDKK